MGWLLAALVVLALMFAPILGYLSSPWAPFWMKGSNAVPPPMVIEPVASGPVDPLDLQPMPGAHISDAQRYQLARTAGWNVEDAIVATAISLAENGSGNPAAMSGRNTNGTYDLGMWQINSAWWPQFGGQAALTDPWRNAQAAYYIKGRQGWCAWSTYGPGCQYHGCGPPCYLSFLDRARAASRQTAPGGQS